jgi:carboxypeptidase Taq
MVDVHERYEELVRLAREDVLLESIAATLEWDEETHMPRAGADNRARQQALLAGLKHERAVDSRRFDLLAELEEAKLPPDAAVNVRELRAAFERERRLPRQLVEGLAEATALAPLAWVEARRRRDFSVFAPELERVLSLKRQEAACLATDGVGAGHELYDALLDVHEEGLSWRELESMFRELEPALARLIERGRGAHPGKKALGGAFSLEAQRKLARHVANAIGFDLAAGQIDPGVHPCTIGLGPGDCRLTARWSEDDLTVGVLTVLHELGHGLYEQGLDQEAWGLPCGNQVSDSMDESQARLYEVGVGKSLGLWTFLWPTLVELFPQLSALDRDACVRSLSHLKPGWERGTADDVSYHMHIFIRTELERALIRGDLRVSELPAAWDEQYRMRLGVIPTDVSQGCLQDGHWAEGLIGYFPCYTLGDVYAATLLSGAERDLGDLDRQWSSGDFAPLREWLRQHVHGVGSRCGTRDIVAAAAGEKPRAQHLIDRLSAQIQWAYDAT